MTTTWAEQRKLWVNSRGGLVKLLKKIEPTPGLPMMHRYLAVMEANLEPPLTIRGSGFAASEEVSQQSAIGEAVERYCASHVVHREIRTATFQQLRETAVDPTTITRPTREQLLTQPHLSEVGYDSEFDWVKGHRLGNGEPTWLPFELVYQVPPRYKPLRDVISTGLACGPSLEFAQRNALCECLERDAVMLFWLLGMVQFEIQVEETKDPAIDLLLHTAKRSNLLVRFYDITQEEFGVPTVLTVVQADGRQGFYLGSSTAFSYRDAIRKSLQEGLGGYSVFFEFLHLYDREAPQQPEDILTLEDHSLYYMTGSGDAALRQLLPSDLPKRSIFDLLQQPPLKWENVVQVLEDHDHPAYLVELTTSDVQQMGFHVCRVTVPTLVYLPVREPFLECKRLHQKKQLLKRNFNLLPHPFP